MAMDEAVRLMYRELLRTGFEYSGKIENPSIFLDTTEEGIRLCSAPTEGYMNIYARVQDDIIVEISYMCACDPTANVVVETMCKLLKGKSLDEAGNVTEEDYYESIGSSGETLVKRVGSMIELIGRGIDKYKSESVLS